MAKPYRVRNLLGLFTLVVLGFSGLFTSLFFIVLRAVKILPPAFFATVWMPLIIVAVANLFAAGVNYIFVPKVIRPLESMIEATKKIGSGDFSVRVPSDHLDGEMKELADSLNTMTEELGNTEIFRSDFIRDFSHEFKTPIVSMKGFARQLKNRDLSEAEREQYCDIIISEADRLTEMSQNILTLSRFENQQIVTDKEPFRLDEQIRDCVLILEKEWEKKSLNLELELSPIVLEQNKGMLQHVWINLVGNAVKFTDPEGKIRIEGPEEAVTEFREMARKTLESS